MENELPRIGISLDTRGLSAEDMLSLSREAEEAGLYAIAVGDAFHDTYALLSAMAMVTSRIRLISAVATWTRTPLTAARAVRTVDLLSGGRYSLGLGSMPPSFNENLHGIPYKAPLKRMSEYMELVRLLWEAQRGTSVDYEGSFYRVSGYRSVEKPPGHHIPLLIGATRPRMIRMSAEKADGAILNVIHSIPWLRDVALPALAEGAERGGRTLKDVERGIAHYAIVTDDSEQARRIMQRTLAFYMSTPYGLEWLAANGFSEEGAAISEAQSSGDRRGMAGAISDRVIDAVASVGTPEECRQRVAQLGSLVDWVLLSTPAALPPSEQMSAFRALIKTFGDGWKS